MHTCLSTCICMPTHSHTSMFSSPQAWHVHLCTNISCSYAWPTIHTYCCTPLPCTQALNVACCWPHIQTHLLQHVTIKRCYKLLNVIATRCHMMLLTIATHNIGAMGCWILFIATNAHTTIMHACLHMLVCMIMHISTHLYIHLQVLHNRVHKCSPTESKACLVAT